MSTRRVPIVCQPCGKPGTLQGPAVTLKFAPKRPVPLTTGVALNEVAWKDDKGEEVDCTICAYPMSADSEANPWTGPGLFLTQLHHPLQSRRKQREIRCSASLLPEVITLGFGRGECTDKVRIQCLLPPEILLQKIKIARLAAENRAVVSLLRANSPLLASLGDQLRVALGTLTRMELAGQKSQLLTPPGGTTTGHSGVLIPVERSGYGIHNLCFVKMRAETIPSRFPGCHGLH